MKILLTGVTGYIAQRLLTVLTQTATFRPLGLMGRLYWYAVLPFHGFIFKGMIRNISAE